MRATGTRLGGHLSATYDLLGLYDLNPAAFSRMKLSLPAEEMKNGLPGILDEALWQMPLWRRLQLPDGGVRGGYGVWLGLLPRRDQFHDQKYAGVYAVDHETTMHYAAAAARAARVLTAFDKKLAAEYLESARRAWTWVESHAKADDAIYKKVLSLRQGAAEEPAQQAGHGRGGIAGRHARSGLRRGIQTVLGAFRQRRRSTWTSSTPTSPTPVCRNVWATRS